MTDAGNPITTHRTEIRFGLLALAAPVVIIGLWALVAPHDWYREFPVGTGRWISSLGPYDEHLVRDFGSLYLALGALLAFAAVVLDRILVLAVLCASLVFQVPHLVFHAANTEPFSTVNNVVNLGVLVGGLLLTLFLLSTTSRDHLEAAASPHATTTEGGIGNGTSR
jgi:hypothetical protein